MNFQTRILYYTVGLSGEPDPVSAAEVFMLLMRFQSVLTTNGTDGSLSC